MLQGPQTPVVELREAGLRGRCESLILHPRNFSHSTGRGLLDSAGVVLGYELILGTLWL